MNWNTKIINFIHDELKGNPSSFVESPFYKLNPLLRKENLVFEYTKEEQETLDKILTYLPSGVKEFYNFVFINSMDKHPAVLNKIKTFSFQENLAHDLKNFNYHLIVSGRQMGISTILAIDALHDAMNRKKIQYFTGSIQEGIEFLNKVKTIYELLPFYMKPGISSYNARSIQFDNGAKILCAVPATSGSVSSMINESSDVVILAECGKIKDFKKFYESMYPIMAAKHSKIIIHANRADSEGVLVNMYNNAKRKANLYNLTELDWSNVPTRNPAFKDNETKALGGIELFEKEYELSDFRKQTPESFTPRGFWNTPKKSEEFGSIDPNISLVLKELKMQIEELKEEVKSLKNKKS